MIFDEFVGLPFKRMGRDRDGLDCWGLTRLVLAERAGVVLPRFDDEDPQGWSIETHAANYKCVGFGETRPLDVAIMLTDVRCGLTWKSAPVHIGLFTDPKHVLHIEEGHSSRIQPASELRIHSIVRVTG